MTLKSFSQLPRIVKILRKRDIIFIFIFLKTLASKLRKIMVARRRISLVFHDRLKIQVFANQVWKIQISDKFLLKSYK